MKYSIIILLSILSSGLFAQSNIVVYPGDSNNDGVVNGLDYLSLGFKAYVTGIQRNSSSVFFQPQQSVIWSDDSTRIGKNATYADCNGDGIVDLSDLDVIDLNVGQSRTNANPVSFSAYSLQAPPLNFRDINSFVNASDTISFEIDLGSDDVPLTNFHGIAFSLNYDTSFIKVYFDSYASNILPNIPVIHSNSGFVTPNKNNIYFSLFQRAHLGIAEGFDGKISAVIKGRIIFEENVGLYMRPETPIIIDFRDIFLLDNQNRVAAIYPENKSFYIQKTLNSIFPNPTSKSLTLYNINCETINIFNTSGGICFSQNVNKNDIFKTIDLGELPQGMYLMQLKTEGKIFYHKIVKK